MAWTIDSRRLSDLVGPQLTGDGPLYEQLANTIARLIDRGDLGPGTRLPSERTLSAELGLSRTTVVAAYDRLRTTGQLRSRQGSGTRVAGPRAGWGPHVGDANAEVPLDLPFLGLIPAEPLGPVIELTIGALPGDPLISEEAERMVREDLPKLLHGFGYEPQGLLELRRAIAERFERSGLPTSEAQILVTSGAQQAISLLASQLVGTESNVLIENPAYVGALEAFRETAARLAALPVDEHGVQPEAFRRSLDTGPVALAYLSPFFQNPTGVVLAADRRRQIVETASRGEVYVIEDLTTSHVAFGEPAPPPMATDDRAGRVLTIDSMSKIAWGGLRIGWLRGPQPLIRRLAARKSHADLGSSIVSQALAIRLIPRLNELASLGQNAATDRLEAITVALASQLPSWSWSWPKGGLSLWVRLPAGDSVAFTRVAAEHGVIIRPGPSASVDGSFRDHVRISFGHDPETLREAVARLAAAWAHFDPTRSMAASGLSITV